MEKAFAIHTGMSNFHYKKSINKALDCILACKMPYSVEGLFHRLVLTSGENTVCSVASYSGKHLKEKAILPTKD